MVVGGVGGVGVGVVVVVGGREVERHTVCHLSVLSLNVLLVVEAVLQEDQRPAQHRPPPARATVPPAQHRPAGVILLLRSNLVERTVAAEFRAE